MSQNENTLLVVSALLVTRKNADHETEILNVLAHNKTRYGFPGGKLEPGESPEAAVIRETEEELGTRPTDIEFVETCQALTNEGRPITMHVFKGSVSENIKPTNEIAEIYWFTHEQMRQNEHLLTPITIECVMPLLRTM